MTLDRVISVCTAHTIDIWTVTQARLPTHIDAREYVVIVPDHEVKLFRSVSIAGWRVEPESRFVGNLKQQIEDRLPSHIAKRSGWYLQQAIKLSALTQANPDQLFLLWDADTIPLRTLQFRTPDQKILHYRAKESHLPYFENMHRLLGFGKQVPYSFVAQCFAIKGNWVKGFIDLIQRRHGGNWIDAMLESIDFTQVSGFSEFELLGNYCARFHGHEMVPSAAKWHRKGNRLIGGISQIDTPKAKRKLRGCDFVAFETWDPPKRQPGGMPKLFHFS